MESRLVDEVPGVIGWAVKRGLSEDDARGLVHEAIVLLLAGERRWDRERVDLA